MQGAWALLLGRLTGRRDVVFGAVVSGRPPELPGVESMVGLFVNTLPVRVRLDPTTTVTAAGRHPGAAVRPHRPPAPRVWPRSSRSAPDRRAVRHRASCFQNYPMAASATWTASCPTSRCAPARHACSPSTRSRCRSTRATGCVLHTQYRPDIFDASTVADPCGPPGAPAGRRGRPPGHVRWAGSTRWPTTSAAASSATGAARRRLRPQLTVPELFEAHAAATPDAAALVVGTASRPRTPNSTARPTGWPAARSSRASAPSRSSRSRCPAAPRWWSRCSPS